MDKQLYLVAFTPHLCLIAFMHDYRTQRFVVMFVRCSAHEMKWCSEQLFMADLNNAFLAGCGKCFSYTQIFQRRALVRSANDELLYLASFVWRRFPIILHACIYKPMVREYTALQRSYAW